MAKSTSDVICLSDDEPDDDITDIKIDTPVVSPEKRPESPIIINNNDDDDNSSSNSNKKRNDNNNNIDDKSAWILTEKDIIHPSPLPSKYSDLYKKAFEIRCSAIRFGIAEFNVDTEVVLMHPREFEMKITGGFLESVNVKLAYTDVIAFYFSFESQTPVALIQVRSEFARLFDRHIPTSDEKGRGFDPDSKDVKRRRIIFLLKTLTPEMERIHISTIYHFLKGKCPRMDIRCISGTRAQELYNLARYAKVSLPNVQKTIFTLKANDLTAKTVGLNKNKVRFELAPEDLHCLNEGEFLNDNIIDFYLQYVFHEKLSDEDRKHTHLFNSFFYTRLTQKNRIDQADITPGERRYNRVKRWFRNVDLFSKDFLIIPINQNAHWYIVLIHKHNNVTTTKNTLPSEDEDYDGDPGSKSKKKKRRCVRVTSPTKQENTDEKPNTRTSVLSLDGFDDADEVESDDEIPVKVTIESLVSSKARAKSPAIVIFDSFRVESKTRVAATLREFLQIEYSHKKGSNGASAQRKTFNMNTIPTIDAAVPQQRNYSDCGLYVLQYIESYFAHRASKMSFPLASTFSDWCEKNLKGSTKRQEILNVINDHVIPKEM